jgi:hypothetical protein
MPEVVTFRLPLPHAFSPGRRELIVLIAGYL